MRCWTLVRDNYLDDPSALRWNVTIRNEGQNPIEDVSITPLSVHLSVDPDKSHPRVRHMKGSYHFDAAYPPRAFR